MKRKTRIALIAVPVLGVSLIAISAAVGSTSPAAPVARPAASAPATPAPANPFPMGSPPSAPVTHATTPPPAPAAPATTPPPAPEPPATTAPPAPPATPAMTASQQQAVDSAQGYLSDGQGFSESGLLKQLTSQYGEGFSAADAQFAISRLNPDWNVQAVESAQGYMADGQGFSRSGLIQQLTSQYGEGFTEAQAEFAANQVGL